MSSPPNYTATNEPLLADQPRSEGDHIPDDFKWSDVVAECAIDIRHRFVQRVYTILVAQLALTVAVGVVVTANSTVNQWALTHPWAMFVSMFAAIGFMIGAMVYQRSYPTNLILLGIFTLFEAYVVGVISSTYDTGVVLITLGVTAFIFAGLSFVALQSKYDFTGWAPYLATALLGLIGFGFVSLFFPSSRVELAYSIIAVIIFCGYILVDTQMILTQYHPEDEVAAAISLYLDIINLFLNLLRIISQADDN